MDLHAYLWTAIVTASPDQKEPTCLVALSGGADSMALLCAALPLAREGKLHLAAAHIHHGIRGEEADRDAKFCQAFCARESIPLHLCHVDVPKIARESGKSLEVAARDARYEALDALQQAHGYDWVLTAHHRDDQIETVLLRLLRGTSPQGLCGIPPRRAHYLRPFLELDRADLLAFCAEHHIAYVEDSTNNDLEIPRNLLRHRVIPSLKELQPQLGAAITRTLTQLREEQDYLDALLASYAPTTMLSDLQALPTPLLRRFLAKECYRSGLSAVQSVHLGALTELVQTGQTGQCVSLPDGFCAHRTYDRLLIERTQAITDFSPITLQYGWNPLPGGDAIYYTEDEKEAKEVPNIYKFETSAILNSATIVEKLFCRPRHQGDTLRQGGMTRKPKTLFQAKQIDATQRARIPFVCDAAGVVWIPFVGLCDRAVPSEKSKKGYLFYLAQYPLR